MGCLLYKSKSKVQYASFLLTLIVIVSLLIAGPARAITINLEEVSSDEGVFSYRASIDIHSDDIIPLDLVAIRLHNINDSSDSTCYFNFTTKELSNFTNSLDQDICSMINITNVTNRAQYIESSGTGYGYGYGTAWGNENISWSGYGYTYKNGYGYNTYTEDTSTNGEIIVDFTIDTTTYGSVANNLDFRIYAGVSGIEDNDVKFTYYNKDFLTFTSTGYYTTISSCGEISESGLYKLGNSVSANNTCFNITADNVVVDCQDYEINYSVQSSGYGFLVLEYDNFTAQNCVINHETSSVQAYDAFYVQNSDNSSFYNNTVNLRNASDVNGGIYVYNSSYVNISSNVFNCNGSEIVYGIFLDTSSNSYVYDNNITSLGLNLSLGVYTFNNTNNPYTYIIHNRVIALDGESGGVALWISDDNNLIYDNYLSSDSFSYAGTDSGSKPMYVEGSYTNYLNTTKNQTGNDNIMGHNYIGGNYWTNPSEDGYSDNCIETDGDYICDDPYQIDVNNTDYYPLADSTTDRDGSGGGTFTSFWTSTSEVSLQSLEQGLVRPMKERQRLRYYIDGHRHYIGIVSMTDTTVTVNVSSTPQQATISIGETKKFEVTDDNYYDISITLNSINTTISEAELLIKYIYELIPGTTNQTYNQSITNNTILINNSINSTSYNNTNTTNQNNGSTSEEFSQTPINIVLIILIFVGVIVLIYLNLKSKKDKSIFLDK